MTVEEYRIAQLYMIQVGGGVGQAMPGLQLALSAQVWHGVVSWPSQQCLPIRLLVNI